MSSKEEDPLFGSFGNLALIEGLYLKYQEDKDSVDPSWYHYFKWFENHGEKAKPLKIPLPLRPKLSPPGPDASFQSLGQPQTSSEGSDQIKIYNLIHAYREHGHLLAQCNPIATEPPNPVEELDPFKLGFTSNDLNRSFPTIGFLSKDQAPLQEIIDALQETYCGTIGVEYMELISLEMEKWLQSKIEPSRFHLEMTIEQKKNILKSLNESELFEVFLHTKYTGQKRFSVEGAETLIPVLNTLVEGGAELGIEHSIMGMAHRGRLNVLSNVLNKSYADIFSEFQDSYLPGSFEGSGDVKYHKGYATEYVTESGRKVKVTLMDNPSHLEAVNGVVEGYTRARQIQGKDDVEQTKVMPILIHGDAAIAGQGIIYETLQMYKLPGYSSGGTIHVIINNQIGFTTLPKDSRSTHYCTDIARAFSAPVFHVNAEKPEECIQAAILALEIRQRYHCDVFLELNCYRKFGHNEGDEPAFTQPLEYQLIRKKKPIREIYRDALIHQGVLEKQMAEELEKEFKNSLQDALNGILQEEEKRKKSPVAVVGPGEEKEGDDLFEKVDTTVSQEDLKEITTRFCSPPEGFILNRKLKRLLEQRMEMLAQPIAQKSIDWGMGEHLAFASLIWEGHHVRISGQDSRRGTFSHRHAMWVDQKNADKYFPLSNLKEDQGRFDVFNSPLSEYSVLGFEYGYSLARKNSLVIWEAQFGDFCNGAQIIIDQFISSSEQKWGVTSGLVLMLPHGYEGQGPEHSSARMERFLQLSGDQNMQVVNASNPAQLFHLLRRQVLRKAKKPLIILTPKALLRSPECISPQSELIQGGFQEVMDDPNPPLEIQRILICSGKIYYDLVNQRRKSSKNDAVIIRVEQLYPLDKKGLKKIFEEYGKKHSIKEIAWVQEEAKNMGAWPYIHPYLREIKSEEIPLNYYGRARSASPAVGSLRIHKLQHQEILEAVFPSRDPNVHDLAKTIKG